MICRFLEGHPYIRAALTELNELEFVINNSELKVLNHITLGLDCFKNVSIHLSSSSCSLFDADIYIKTLITCLGHNVGEFNQMLALNLKNRYDQRISQKLIDTMFFLVNPGEYDNLYKSDNFYAIKTQNIINDSTQMYRKMFSSDNPEFKVECKSEQIGLSNLDCIISYNAKNVYNSDMVDVTFGDFLEDIKFFEATGVSMQGVKRLYSVLKTIQTRSTESERFFLCLEHSQPGGDADYRIKPPMLSLN